MARQHIDPDALASKTFLVTILGAILYIAVVFIFVIANNDQTTGDPSSPEPHLPTAHAEGH